MLAEIGVRVVEQLEQHVAVENVDAHRGQEQIFRAALDFQEVIHVARDDQFVLRLLLLRLLHEVRDAPLAINLHDAQPRRLRALDRDGGNGQVRLRFHVLMDHLAEIHPVKLVAAQDEHVVEIMVEEVH